MGCKEAVCLGFRPMRGRFLQPTSLPLTDAMQSVVVFKIDGDVWTLDLRPGKGSLSKGEPSDKADLELTMGDTVFVNLVLGKTSSQQAFLMRKLKINGSMGLAMKLQPILDAAAPKSKM